MAFRICCSQARQAGVKLKLQRPIFSPPPGFSDLLILADKYKFAQVIRNLLSNALKFTSRCGHVTVEIRLLNMESCSHISDMQRGPEARNSTRNSVILQSIRHMSRAVGVAANSPGHGHGDYSLSTSSGVVNEKDGWEGRRRTQSRVVANDFSTVHHDVTVVKRTSSVGSIPLQPRRSALRSRPPSSALRATDIPKVRICVTDTGVGLAKASQR